MSRRFRLAVGLACLLVAMPARGQDAPPAVSPAPAAPAVPAVPAAPAAPAQPQTTPQTAPAATQAAPAARRPVYRQQRRRPVARRAPTPRETAPDQSDTLNVPSVPMPSPNSTPAPVPNRYMEAPRATPQEGPRVSPSFISPRVNERFGGAVEGEVYRHDRMQPAPGARLTVPFEYDR
ncbi:hypothetical protein M0638_05195 [Roseomonas sp. NAR14]|uniref:Uncharacterized protein n=1 Tax=Roseomonas acroporae TaxID=2937791 RepID=A0A9X2BT18_9PROT|nr:hypothetical protein [Roseomonas acroporae]MCK8783777.1 hypothetical protein [Roseomonas acroporae]